MVKSHKSRQQQPRPPSPLDPQLPLVSGKWLAWSLLGIFGGGVALVYLTICLLFWQGQWQILFQRTQPVTAIPAVLSSPTDAVVVRFDTTETGQPRLEGLMIGASAANKTILFLPGTMADAFSARNESLTDLQQIGFSAFTFNYHGATIGDTDHPSEQLATDDTEAAWKYLVETRHLAPSSIVFYGQGLGAALAAAEVARHPEAGGLIVENALPTAREILSADARSHLLSVRLLSHDTFNPAPALMSAKQPKLFLLTDQDAVGKRYAASALDPKVTVYLLNRDGGAAKREALKGFLDQLP